MRVLMACLSLALLSACGSSSPTSSTSSAPANTTAGGGGGAAPTAAGTMPPTPKGCSVVTQAEAAAVMGASVTQQDGGYTCLWDTGDGHELNVQIFSAGAVAASAVQAQPCPTGSSTSVSGVGDAAISCSGYGSHILIFAKSGFVIHLACGGNCTAAGLVTAAQAAAGRL